MTKDKKNKNDKRRTSPLAIIFGLMLVSIITAVALTGYAYAYSDKSLLNTYLHGENISSQSKQEIEKRVEQVERENPDRKIVVAYGDKEWELSFDDMNWNLDKSKTVDAAFSYGHTEDLKIKIIQTVRSVFVKKEFDLSYSFNESVVLDWINSINNEIGQSKKETTIIIKKDEVKVTDSSPGRKIDDANIKQAILDRLSLKAKGEIKAELIEDQPIISKDEAEALIDRAKELTRGSAQLTGPKGSVEISKSELGSIIKLKKEIKERGFLKDKLGDAYVSFDDDKIKNILQKSLNELNIPSKDAKFTISNGQIALISPSETGKEIKMDESVSLIVKNLEQGKAKTILPEKLQEPSISATSSQDIEKIGIKEIIGSATTDFKKSPSNRVHNIETGLKYLSGAIIKPGEEFSTVKRLGAIDQSGGYLPELVIKENETVPEFGGGLCQVSTTLFRAAMKSGLKITERRNHSYRVSYYEPPVGMDATIYSPKPDFKFINDTSSYILLHGHIDGTKITFDLYGTKDGRVSEITEPVVYDITNPPEPIYVDDPSLEPGEVRQTDKAHPGAKAVFYYRVKKDGKVTEEKFVSSYVPWPAKYLRGPQVESSPTPQPQ